MSHPLSALNPDPPPYPPTLPPSQATVDFQFQDDDMFLAKILVPEGTEDVQVGSIVALVVDKAGDVAAVKASTYTPAASASAPAAPAPAPAAPKAAPAPATPAPAPAAPAPAPAAPAPAAKAAPAAPAPAPAATAASSAPAASGDDSYLAFPAWGQSLARAGLGGLIARQQAAYTSVFGYTGHDPLPLPETGEKKGQDGAPAGDKKGKEGEQKAK
jgi:hypothetical protein